MKLMNKKEARLVGWTSFSLCLMGTATIYFAREGDYGIAVINLLAYGLVAGWFGFVVGVGPPLPGER